jgi:hypothetical protein
MSFLDFLTGKINCPRCGTSGAKEEGGQILCPNPSCAYYAGAATGSESPASDKPSSGQIAGAVPRVGFAPARKVTIRYRNYKGEEKEFSADADSGARKKKHISLRVAPKGVRIVLSRDRILNWNEVDEELPQRLAPGQNPPSPRERQVLAYHTKYKTTSPLYEQIRAKYPHW